MKDGRQAFFLFLPDGEDPDSIVRSEGAAGFDQRLQHATPLSQFFYDELGKDVNLATLDGKARLAERAKPLLAQIPDGAFGDLMRQRLGEITGVGVQRQPALPEKPKIVSRAPVATQKRSLVRGAISVLLQQPSLALSLMPPYGFRELKQPGVELLVELLSLVQARPEITTGALLQHFAEREELVSLQKLASQVLPGEEGKWRQELLDAAEQLEDQAVQQRIAELQAKMSAGGLDVADKYELTALLQAQRRRGSKPA
jgi:DNA primase